MKVHYIGPPGSFSEQAAVKLTKRADTGECIPEPTFEAVARAVAHSTSKADFGVLPYYNFLEGLVQENLDLTYEYGLAIVSAIRLPVTFGLGTSVVDADKNEVVSHPKGLAQCSDYISRHFPDATLTPVGSTSEAARQADENPKLYAISSLAALRSYDLRILEDDIGNVRHGKNNFTDFFVVAQADAAHALGDANDRTMIALTPPLDRPGLLADVLCQFSFLDLNIAKIHSRPALDDVGVDGEPQMFYLEVLSKPDAPSLRRCLATLDYRFSLIENASAKPSTRILGSFALSE